MSVAPGQGADQGMVIQSFQLALGRNPNPQELQVVMHDPRALTWDGLFSTHRAALAQDANLRGQVVTNAFQKVFGHPVSGNQQDYFSQWLSNEQQNLTLYNDLLGMLTHEYVHQAYTRIFGFFPTTMWSEDAGVYQSVEQRVRGGQMSGAAIWNYVAISNSIHGAARTDYNGSRDQCIGGLGRGCNGTSPCCGWNFRSEPQPLDFFTTYEGTQMEYIQLPIAVGSILHDAACANPAGVWCTAQNSPLLVNRSDTAGLEWSKAVWDFVQNRMWFHEFGPYAVGDVANWSDDLRIVPNRPAGLPDPGSGLLRVGNSGDDMPLAAAGGENAGSTVLLAPAGANLDITDGAYCAAGRFASNHDYLLTKWGTCA
ncbi:MAG TPA: hypothetical protein VGQ42_11510 [Candidatus Dormibacteraeota bacterium]|nr:hypothetical protein [Candidatus Dormibacteraeota bacterium]